LAIQHSFGDNSRLLAVFDEDGNPCSFAWSIRSDTTGFMLYGGRNQVGQKLRANPAIYWAAINDALDQGCSRYDLNGLLGEGITEFKKSFAKHEDFLIGTLAAPINPPLYAAWARALPNAKRYLRAFRERDLKLLKPQEVAVS
jgi:lipid II:glycine glycyltransferase (peptidoglycan interpeptide bridge formation enzyme)